MKLWTIQKDVIIDSLKFRHFAAWEYASENFRPGYRWMAHHLRRHTGVDAVPVWCWHSCNGRRGAGPTVNTAHSLIGDWDFYAHQMHVIELQVPESVSLLSSYWLWNELLDETITTQRIPDFDSHYVSMFEEPLIKHDTDDIQAVLPYIERAWIVDVRPLPLTCGASSEAI